MRFVLIRGQLVSLILQQNALQLSSRRMRSLQALCVLLLLAVAGVASAAKRPTFAEWLKQHKAEGEAPAASETQKPASVGVAAVGGSNTEATVSDYYEEMETTTVCLKEIGLRNCRCVDCSPATACCKTRYYESSLTCCSHEEYYNYNQGGSGFLPSLANHEIGSCDITSYFFDNPVDVATGVTKLGTFQMVCNIDGGGRCGEPFCDNMILTQNGAIYNATEVVSKSNPAQPAEDAACQDVATNNGPNVHRTARTMTTAFGTKFSSTRKPLADVASAAYYGGESTTTHIYYMSNAVIWTGPVTITSLHHDVQYYHGTMEYAFWDSAAAVEVTEAECNNRIMVNPYTYTLKLSKKHGNYY